MKNTPRRLLVVRTGGLGDVLLALPALRALRKCCGGDHITFLGSSESVAVVRDEGLWDDLVAFRRSPQRPGGFLCPGRFLELAWMAGLRRGRFDRLAVLQPILSRAGAMRLRVLARLSRAAVTAGRDTDGLGSFYKLRYPELMDSDMHEVERVFGVAALLGADGPRDAGLRPSAAARHAAEAFLAETGLSGARPLIGINPGSFRPTYQWPPERFAAVASELCRASGGSIVLLGAPGEERFEQMPGRAIDGPVTSAIGKTRLADLPAFLEALDLLVTNDTGAMHVAAAVGTPVVAIFARGDPRRTGPFAPPERARVVTNHLCGLPNGFGCRDPRCLLNVSVDQVLEASLELLR